MSTETPAGPKQSAAPQVLAYLGIAVVMFGVGMLVESQLAAKAAAEVKQANETEMKSAADKASSEKQALSDELAKERSNHETAIQAKDKSLAAVSSRAAGVRRALEADLSAARSSGDACTSRIARISEAIDGVFDSVGEVAGVAKDLGRENEQLKADNQSLSDKLAGWQKWNTDRMNKIVVTGQKGGS
jgi:chromosome segregation ATPase